MEAPATAPQGSDPVIVTSKTPVIIPLTNPAPTSFTGTQATPQDQPVTFQPKIAGTVPQTTVQDPVVTGHTEVDDPTSQSTSESNRSSNRSKKPTKFYGDPLRHSVKSVAESDPVESSSQRQIIKQPITTPFTPIVRKGSQMPSPRTKEQTIPFKKIRIDDHDKTS